MIFRKAFPTPYGAMQVGVLDNGTIVEVLLPNRGPFAPSNAIAPDAASTIINAVMRQFEEYFAGRRRAFDLPIDPRGTPFELRVWERLQAIPFGKTASYGEIAGELRLVNGARAVGRANGANPIPIIVPCHRVIGGDGTLTGFGGGLDLKRALLELEGALPISLELPL